MNVTHENFPIRSHQKTCEISEMQMHNYTIAVVSRTIPKKNVIFQIVTCPSSGGTLYLFTYLSIYPSIYLSIYLSVHLSIYLSIHPSIYCFTVEPGFQGHCEGLRLGFHSWTWIPGSLWSSTIYLPTYLSIYLSIYLSTYLPTYLSIYPSIYLSIYCFTVEPGFQGHCEGLRLGFHSWTWIPGSLWSSAIYLPTYLPIYLSIYLSTYLPTYLSIYPSIYLSIYPSIYLSIYLLLHSWTWIPGSLWRTEAGVSQLNLDSRVTVELRNLPTYLSIYLSIYLPTYLPTYLSIYPSIYLSIYCFTVEPGFQGHCEGLRLGFHSWTWIPGSLWSSAMEPGIQGPFSWIRRALNKGHIILLKKESPEQGLVRALRKQ